MKREPDDLHPLIMASGEPGSAGACWSLVVGLALLVLVLVGMGCGLTIRLPQAPPSSPRPPVVSTLPSAPPSTPPSTAPASPPSAPPPAMLRCAEPPKWGRSWPRKASGCPVVGGVLQPCELSRPGQLQEPVEYARLRAQATSTHVAAGFVRDWNPGNPQDPTGERHAHAFLREVAEDLRAHGRCAWGPGMADTDELLVLADDGLVESYRLVNYGGGRLIDSWNAFNGTTELRNGSSGGGEQPAPPTPTPAATTEPTSPTPAPLPPTPGVPPGPPAPGPGACPAYEFIDVRIHVVPAGRLKLDSEAVFCGRPNIAEQGFYSADACRNWQTQAPAKCCPASVDYGDEGVRIQQACFGVPLWSCENPDDCSIDPTDNPFTVFVGGLAPRVKACSSLHPDQCGTWPK